MSSSDKELAVDLNYGTELGIQPISGLFGDFKNSRIVSISFASDVVTVIPR